jgi:hypothetical protein
VRPGEIHFRRNFYYDRETGELRGKYLLALAVLPGGDIVFRLLTSRPHGRREAPPCFHGDPYPSYFLGVPGNPLDRNTWVDLRSCDDYDGASAAGHLARGELVRVKSLSPAALRPIMECVAAANDTTRLQERAIRDQMAALGI